jgi:hypothetical protein
LLEVPETLAERIPAALPRGVVAVLTGARSLPLSMVAAVTAAGGHAAIVGQPRAGLLAAVEMGADLSRVAVIPDPGADPVEVAAVLLLVTGGDWSGAQVRLDATVSGYEVVGAGAAGPVPGCGRIGRVRLVTRARGRIPGLPRVAAVGG